jgi:hypothetical protein
LRSHIHKNPDDEHDVQVLISAHKRHQMHNIIAEREINTPKDFVLAGIKSIRDKKQFIEYHKKQEVYFKATSSKQVFGENIVPQPTSQPPSVVHTPQATSNPHSKADVAA